MVYKDEKQLCTRVAKKEEEKTQRQRIADLWARTRCAQGAVCVGHARRTRRTPRAQNAARNERRARRMPLAQNAARAERLACTTPRTQNSARDTTARISPRSHVQEFGCPRKLARRNRLTSTVRRDSTTPAAHACAPRAPRAHAARACARAPCGTRAPHARARARATTPPVP